MIVYHAAITASADFLDRASAYRQAHLERMLELRARGLVIGASLSPDGNAADVFYRVRQPSEITAVIEEDPYFRGHAWVAYTLRSFSQFIEPWELPPPATDGSRTATITGGIATDPDMANFALIEWRGMGRLAFGGFFEAGQTLGLFRTSDPDTALGWLTETGFWQVDSLTARPLCWLF